MAIIEEVQQPEVEIETNGADDHFVDAEDDFVDFDVVTNATQGSGGTGGIGGTNNGGRLGQQVSTNQLLEGTVIDIDPESEVVSINRRAEEEESGRSGGGDGATWWSRDELRIHLEENQLIDTFEEDDAALCDFTELKKKMEPVATADDGQVYLYKRTKLRGFGPKVNEDSTITYHLEAYMDGDQEPFDSTYMRQKPFLTRMNVEFLVPGLYHGLLTMRVGEKAAFLVHPNYAFGKLGIPPRIRPEAEILYIVHVIKLMEEGSLGDYLTMTLEDQLKVPFEKIVELADTERKSGNGYFKTGRKREAGVRYQRALRVLEGRAVENKEQEQKLNDLLLKLYCNLANTSCYLNRPYSAMKYARLVLELDKGNVKALYFYGRAYIDAGEYEKAKRYLLRAKEIKPDNKEIAEQLRRLEMRIKEDDKVSKALAKDMAKAFFK